MRRFAQYVLPKIDKFLESHEEKRLRRLRSGVVTALIGLAVGIPPVCFSRMLQERLCHIPRIYPCVFGGCVRHWSGSVN